MSEFQPLKVNFSKNETTEIKLKFDTMFPGHKWTVSTWQNIYPELAKYPIAIQEKALFILLNRNLSFPPSPSQYINACKEAYQEEATTNPDFYKRNEPVDEPVHSQNEHARIHGFSTFNALIQAIKDNIYDYKSEHQKLLANNRAGYKSRLKEIRNASTEDN